MHFQIKKLKKCSAGFTHSTENRVCKDVDGWFSAQGFASPKRDTERSESTTVRRQSFTILESIAVIVIIGILVVIATPRFEVFQLIKFQGAGRKLISDIRYAQNKAVSAHINTAIYFRTDQERYLAFQCDPGLSDCTDSGQWTALMDPFTRQDLEVDYTTDPQYRGPAIASANFNATDYLRFDWEGIPQDRDGNNLTANGTVVLDYVGESITITIIPQTGKVNTVTTY
ncbi:MAG: hypothetical protein GY858_02175 [Candidatus Omnitrophica bacterium]|nr:hypothetical protein [Candidatus Omnitrophota bacterium]